MTFHPLVFYSFKRGYKAVFNKVLAGSLAVSFLLSLSPASSWATPKGALQLEKSRLDEMVVGQGSTAGPVQYSSAIAQATIEGRYRALTPDGQGIITYSGSGELFSNSSVSITRLYNLEGVEQATFEGEFQRFSLDYQGLFTYFNGQSYLYSLNGTRLATFQGSPVSYTPDRKGILVLDDFGGTVRMIGGISPTRRYDLNGVEQAVFPGVFADFTPDGESLIATCICESGLVSRLYSLTGVELATLQGQFVGFTPDQQSIVTTDYERTNLYALDGTLKASMKGQFTQGSPSLLRIGLPNIDRSSGFIPGGKGLITSSDELSWLYDFEGNLQQTFRGRFWNFMPEGNSIITSTFGGQSWLYGLDGTLQKTFNGQLLGLTPDSQSLVAQTYNHSDFYRLDGTLQHSLSGSFTAFTPDGLKVVTNGSDGSGYHSLLYDLNGGEPVRLEGLLIGFDLNDQALVTSSGGVYGPYHVYDASGTLQTISTTWPEVAPDGERFVATVEDRSLLYDLAAAVTPGQLSQSLASFPGTFEAFTKDGKGLITYSATDGQSHFYSFDDSL